MHNALRTITIAAVLLTLAAGAQSDVDCHTEIDPYYKLVDVPSLIHISTPADVERIRKEIITYFWPETGFPSDKMPASVRKMSLADAPEWIRSIESDNLATVDRLDIAMDYSLHSYVYHLHPTRPNNRLLIFQMGHSNDILTAGGRETIRWFLDKGFSIMTLWMPLFGENPRIGRNIPGHDTYTFPTGTKGHNVMGELIGDTKGCFIRLFVEPVFVAINHAEGKYDYRDINMAGISGGGWATHICAAIDTRIKLSFPIAGSLPLYLRRGPCPNGSQGDAEQEWPGLFEEIASWPDIYIMGAYGPGRKQIHILNQYDSCCFWGITYRTFAPFTADAVRLLEDGFYDAWLDSSHREHQISKKAIKEIDKYLCPATTTDP